ncbi:MAG: hypothetical protein LUE99_00500 [Bacteroides sp.]|nr:hypothetical protein [Bacteroides sp.]
MSFKKLSILLLGLLPLFFCGCDDDDSVGTDNAPKPEMSLAVSPQTGLHYGDKVSITGTLTDEKNLQMYTILLKDANETELYRKEQMLLGQSFQMSEQFSIPPLPKNATVGNFKVEVVLENSRKGEAIESFDLTSLQVPTFNKLYLLLGNKSVVELSPNGDVFEAEETFPANIKGIISPTPTNTGLYWGTNNGEIQTMAKDSILIGSNIEASCKVTFNPKTFELTFGERHGWTSLPASDSYYILGTISGHWQDGEIKQEKNKMRMQGYESGNLRYYTWLPPEGEDVETGMWGSIAAGTFQLKKAGEDVFVQWNGTEFTTGSAYDAGKSFPVTAGGAFEIRVYFDGDECIRVSVMSNERTLEFTDEQVKANGVVMGNSIDFAGAQLQLKGGTNYLYEGEVELTQGASITSNTIDLSLCTPNKDLFTGGGNANWTLASSTGKYFIQLDAFSGSSYARPASGYPDAIYMYGWSWAHSQSGMAQNWQADSALPLVRVGNSFVYEGTCYVFTWGGDIAFILTDPTAGTRIELPNANFDANSSILNGNSTHFSLPTTEGYYKISVDLKDGVTITEGNPSTVTPNGSANFTLRYTLQ